jgi:hypothetical protein
MGDMPGRVVLVTGAVRRVGLATSEPPVFVRTDAAPAWPHGAVPGVVGWLGSAPPRQAEGRWGLVAGEDLWADADGDLVLATVAMPAATTPPAAVRRPHRTRRQLSAAERTGAAGAPAAHGTGTD